MNDGACRGRRLSVCVFFSSSIYTLGIIISDLLLIAHVLFDSLCHEIDCML
jgi:hypothetical protein